MRTDTTDSNFQITYPDAFSFLGDDNWVKIEKTGSVAIGAVRIDVGLHNDVLRIFRANATGDTFVMHLTDIMRTIGVGDYDINVICGSTHSSTYYTEVRQGRTLPWRDHGCARTIQTRGAGSFENVPIFVPYAPATIDYQNNGSWYQQSVSTPGQVNVTENKFEAGYIRVNYSSATPRICPHGDAWTADRSEIVLVVSKRDCVTCEKRTMFVDWIDADGIQRMISGKVLSDTASVEQEHYRSAELSLYGGSPRRMVTSRQREVTIVFEDVPRDMYLEDIIDSEEVKLRSYDRSWSADVISSTMEVTKGRDEKEDYTFTLLLEI